MVRSLVGAVITAALGALVGAGSLTLAYRRAPGVALPFDLALPHVLAGFYSLERSGELTFSWTSRQATVNLPGLDRQVPWRCTVRLRGGRAAGVTQPTVAIDVDGAPGTRVEATNTFEDVAVDVPPRFERNGLTLTIGSEPTFVPGPGDKRELGVQVDQVACAPSERAGMPPRLALVVAAAAVACFGVAFVALGAPLWLTLLAVVALAGAQALALATGLALYMRYLDRVPWLALWPAVSAVILSAAILWRTGRVASPAARFVLAYSGVALYLLLLAVLHPSKALVDALFHAHRLEWVRAGNFFFTQPMPDGVAFPYAIALYVVASPWMALTRDHVALLRVVVCTAHVLTGLLLYAAVLHRWNDRLAGALAVVLWSLVPQWFVVVGNANLTAAFAQSIATSSLLTAAILTLGPRGFVRVAALFALVSVAFLSHVGTFPLLFAALVLLAIACWWRGDATERVAARWIVVIAVAAAIFSVVTYYGHFAEVYKSLDRVTGRRAAVASPAPAAATASVAAAPTPPATTRAATAVEVGLRAVGWPIAVLCVIGAWRCFARPNRDRLTMALVAWFGTCAVFVAFGVLSPVEPRFYRYTVEFIGRVIYATWPAVIVAAAAGGAWVWRAGPIGRLASAILIAGAVWVGALSWWSWIG
jgi:hypothetical protein